MDKKKLVLLVIFLIGIVAVVGVVLSGIFSQESVTFNGVKFNVPEGFDMSNEELIFLSFKNSKYDIMITPESGFFLENVLSEENVSYLKNQLKSSKPNIIDVNGIKVSEYKNFNYILPDTSTYDSLSNTMSTFFDKITVYKFTKDGQDFILTVSGSQENTEEIVKEIIRA